MKLTVLQENLKNSVSLTSRFISSKAQLPILSNILIKTDKSKLLLSATNLETSITTSIGAKIEKEGEIAINGKTLNDLIMNLSSGNVEIEVEKELLKITSNNFRSNILGSNTSDFPTLPKTIGSNSFSLDSKEFIKALSKVLFSVSTDETRPILTGVLFSFKDNHLYLVSTDGFRLTETKIKIGEKMSDFKMIIPKAILNELSKFSENSEIQMSYDKDNNQVIFSIGETILSSRVIEGEFPEYEKIIPSDSVCNVILDKYEFEKAVKIASVFARDSGNIIKLIIDSPENGQKIKITAESSSSGSQETDLEYRIDKDLEVKETEIMFNFRFIEEFLKIVEADEFLIKIADNNKASKFIDLKSPNVLHIIMPIKSN